jgi:hypothetical protein
MRRKKFFIVGAIAVFVAACVFFFPLAKDLPPRVLDPSIVLDATPSGGLHLRLRLTNIGKRVRLLQTPLGSHSDWVLPADAPPTRLVIDYAYPEHPGAIRLGPGQSYDWDSDVSDIRKENPWLLGSVQIRAEFDSAPIEGSQDTRLYEKAHCTSRELTITAVGPIAWIH